jgi:hypothetical protein
MKPELFLSLAWHRHPSLNGLLRPSRSRELHWTASGTDFRLSALRLDRWIASSSSHNFKKGRFEYVINEYSSLSSFALFFCFFSFPIVSNAAVIIFYKRLKIQSKLFSRRFSLSFIINKFTSWSLSELTVLFLYPLPLFPHLLSLILSLIRQSIPFL